MGPMFVERCGDLRTIKAVDQRDQNPLDIYGTIRLMSLLEMTELL